jgi:hypothetical protein
MSSLKRCSSGVLLVSNVQVQHHQLSPVSYEHISAGTFKGVGDKTIPNLSALCFVYSGIKHQASSIKLYLPFLVFSKLSPWREEDSRNQVEDSGRGDIGKAHRAKQNLGPEPKKSFFVLRRAVNDLGRVEELRSRNVAVIFRTEVAGEVSLPRPVPNILCQLAQISSSSCRYNRPIFRKTQNTTTTVH